MPVKEIGILLIGRLAQESRVRVLLEFCHCV